VVRPRAKVEDLPHGTWPPYNKHGYLGDLPATMAKIWNRQDKEQHCIRTD